MVVVGRRGLEIACFDNLTCNWPQTMLSLLLALPETHRDN
jgi:hypothetical protein